jgi:hypothetical protein
MSKDSTEGEVFINFNDATIRASEIAFVRVLLYLPPRLEVLTRGGARFFVDYQNENDAIAALETIRKSMGALR